MKPLDIRIALLRKGYTAAKLARELGVKRPTVSTVINGHHFSLRIAVGISDVTGIPVPVLFPGREHGRGQKRPRRVA